MLDGKRGIQAVVRWKAKVRSGLCYMSPVQGSHTLHFQKGKKHKGIAYENRTLAKGNDTDGLLKVENGGGIPIGFSLSPRPPRRKSAWSRTGTGHPIALDRIHDLPRQVAVVPSIPLSQATTPSKPGNHHHVVP
jgi:hypothetical protein